MKEERGGSVVVELVRETVFAGGAVWWETVRSGSTDTLSCTAQLPAATGTVSQLHQYLYCTVYAVGSME